MEIKNNEGSLHALDWTEFTCNRCHWHPKYAKLYYVNLLSNIEYAWQISLSCLYYSE